MVPHEHGQVTGELYEVDAPVLRVLDDLEEHPHYYERRGIELSGGTVVVSYLLRPEHGAGRPEVPDGDWARYVRDRPRPHP